MKMMIKKLWRDIRSSLGQFISIVLVLAVGCFFFAGMLEASFSLERRVNGFYNEQNFADATGGYAVVGEDGVNQIKSKPQVINAEGRFYFNSSMRFNGDSVDATVYTRTQSINRPLIKSGANIAGEKECLVDFTYAEAAGLKSGDKIRLFMPEVKAIFFNTVDGSDDPNKVIMEGYNIVYTSPGDSDAVFTEYIVAGTYQSAELLYKVPSDGVSKREEFACVIVPYQSITIMQPSVYFFINGNELPFYTFNRSDLHTSLYNQIVAETDGVINLNDTFDITNTDSETDIAVYISQLSYLRKDDLSHKSFMMAFNQIQTLVFIIPLLFFLVAGVITFISLSKMVDNQRSQIGIMLGIGIDKGSIYFTYILYSMFAAIFGAVLGGIAGIFTLPFIYYLIFDMQFIMPAFVYNITPLFLLVGLAVAVAVSVLAAFISCHRTLKEMPAKAMRPKTEKKQKGTLLEKWGWFWRKISFNSKMMTRNISKNKGRILLSSIGIVGSLMLLISGIGLKANVAYITNDYDKSINYDFMVVLNEYMPVENSQEFKALDTSGNISQVEFNPTNLASLEFGEQKSDMQTIVGLPAGETMIKLFDKTGSLIPVLSESVIVPHILAKELEIQKGDTVKIVLKGYGQKDFMVSDISYQYLMPSVYVSYDIFVALGAPMFSNSAYITTNNLPATKLALQEQAAVKNILTRADMNKRVLDTAMLLDMAVIIIIVGAAVLAITVIFNITSINLYERSREIATLMVLGVKRHETVGMILGENMVTTLIGCIIGVPLGFGLFQLLVSIVSSMNVSMPTLLPFWVYLVSVAAAFVFSILATLFKANRMMKINMVEALKSVE